MKGIINIIKSKISINLEFRDDHYLTKKLINYPDFRGNSPLMLAIILKNYFKEIIFLPIIQELLQNKSKIIDNNSFSVSPLEEAISNKDKETIVLLMEELHNRKMKKMNKLKEKLSDILLESSDFYLDLKWKFNSFIPMLSSLAPSDICGIWKIGENLRLDTNFHDYKKLTKTKRRNVSYLFRKKENISEIYKLINDDKSYFDSLEPFDDDEKMLIINNVLNEQHVKDDLKINSYSIYESKSHLGNVQYETIDGFRTKKYDIEIISSVRTQNRFKYENENLDKNSYFNQKASMNYTIKTNENEVNKIIQYNGKTYLKNEIINSELVSEKKEKDKKLKANMWISQNFPIKTSFLIKLINKLSTTNVFFIKIKDFLNNRNIKSVLDVSGFPVKIKIPLTFLLNVEIVFTNFKEIPYSKENEKLFEIPSDYNKISRKLGENLLNNPKA